MRHNTQHPGLHLHSLFIYILRRKQPMYFNIKSDPMSDLDRIKRICHTCIMHKLPSSSKTASHSTAVVAFCTLSTDTEKICKAQAFSAFSFS